MRKFLRNILYFTIIITFITSVIEVMLLFIPNKYSYKKDYLETHINVIECLLLGNSHIEEALNPSKMGNGVFNLAIAGRNMKYDVELAKKYVPLMKELKVLVVPLEYAKFYLGRNIDNPEEKKSPSNNQDTYKCMHYKYMGIRIDEFWYWSEFLNSKLNFMTSFVKSNKDNIGCDSLGYVALKLSKRNPAWRNRDLPQLIDLTKEIDKQKYDVLYNQFEIIADLAQKENVRFVLLGTPMYMTYQKSMKKEVNEEILSFVHRLQKKYPIVEYYDYCYDNRFVDEDFMDSSHLSEIGANKFSRIVKEEILERKVPSAS